MQFAFGVDIGTTTVSAVVVDSRGSVVESLTRAHEADVESECQGVSEQDPEKFLAAASDALSELRSKYGEPTRIGWTGQMHGVVAVDEGLHPLTRFVTWRDARRFGGAVMQEWERKGLTPFKCLTAPGFVYASLFGPCRTDETFNESWHLNGETPSSWLPEVVDGLMLGDNQAGVYAAQRLVPGCAVVNIGTSGQLSVVVDGEDSRACPQDVERRCYVGGKKLDCRASLIGGQALSALRRRLGIAWQEFNEWAADNPEIRSCLETVVDDLMVGMRLEGISGLVGVGNALRLNPALRVVVERRFGMPCMIPDVTEMAAYGAALYAMDNSR